MIDYDLLCKGLHKFYESQQEGSVVEQKGGGRRSSLSKKDVKRAYYALKGNLRKIKNLKQTRKACRSLLPKTRCNR